MPRPYLCRILTWSPWSCGGKKPAFLFATSYDTHYANSCWVPSYPLPRRQCRIDEGCPLRFLLQTAELALPAVAPIPGSIQLGCCELFTVYLKETCMVASWSARARIMACMLGSWSNPGFRKFLAYFWNFSWQAQCLVLEGGFCCSAQCK